MTVTFFQFIRLTGTREISLTRRKMYINKGDIKRSSHFLYVEAYVALRGGGGGMQENFFTYKSVLFLN